MSKEILIVNIGTEVGGIEKCLINFLKYLEKKDCKVDLALWKANGPLYNQIPSFVNIIKSPGTGSFSQIIKEKNPFKLSLKLFKYMKFKIFDKFSAPWKSLEKNKKKYDIAISYCQNGYSPYYVIDNVNAKEKYLWYHELDYLFDNDKKANDFMYFKKYTKIICVSESCRKNLVKKFPKISDKFLTLYNFYDVEEIKFKATLEKNPYGYTKKKIIATVGRLSEEKGVVLAINSCKELIKYRNDFIWFWIGDGPERNVAISKIRELGIENYFVLLGNQTNPYPYIKNCDLYIQPSLSEAYATTVIEALVLRKPMVLTNVESFYEQVDDGKNALIVKKDTTDLCHGILTAFNYDFNFNDSLINLNDKNKYDELLFS